MIIIDIILLIDNNIDNNDNIIRYNSNIDNNISIDNIHIDIMI